ncbi:MAG: hypothetical protein Q7T17_03485 [Microbacterium sp.]|uniref:hypothetical protein n=1 Tax=Microbacterium sp. TaxID=51671 RepID=UPI00271B72B2|nr:hypothetical protein [Microbacterium sp.]MDO8382025.1 hypothetical protein [Microbacterium sp.]
MTTGTQDRACELSSIHVTARFTLTGTFPKPAFKSEELATDREDRTLAYLLKQQSSWTYRINSYEVVKTTVAEEIDSNWASGWRYYVDGKRVLAQVQRDLRVFSNVTMLIDTVMVRIRNSPDDLPPEVRRLKEHLAELGKLQLAKPVEMLQVTESHDRAVAEAATAAPADSILNVQGYEGYPRGL